MEITRQEMKILNFYRASELHGGLLLGHLAGRTREPQLVLELTRHGAEEVAHAQLWTETLLEVGARPFPTRDTYQARYAAALGRPASLLRVLALTQVFERRVYRHFLEHLQRPGVHPAVRATLRRMIEEEKGHLAWVKRWLDERVEERPGEVEALMSEFSRADQVIYDRLTSEMGWRGAA